MIEGIFYSDKVNEADENDDTQREWCDIVSQMDAERERELSDNLAKETWNGMKAIKLTMLEHLPHHQRDHVRVRYNGGSPARMRPLELRFGEEAHRLQEKLEDISWRTSIFTSLCVGTGGIRT